MRKNKSGISDMAQETGLGTRVWSYSGYVAAKYYHQIFGAFVVLILYFSLAPFYPLWQILFAIGGYLVYLLLRHELSSILEPWFYDTKIQFIRAQIGIFILFGLMWFTRTYDHRLHLWLLFFPSLLIISRHCSTRTFTLSLVEIGALMALVRWGNGHSVEILRAGFWLDDIELMVRWFEFGLVAFVMHYLLRNIDARDDILRSFAAIETLSRQPDNGKLPAEKWQAVLDTYLPLVKGACGAIWLCDHNARRIRALTDFRYCLGQYCSLDNRCDPEWLDFDAEHPLVHVARTAESTYCQSSSVPVENRLPLGDIVSVSVCPLPEGIFSRIAVPILDDQVEQPQTLGILCIDFDKTSSPRSYLLDDYYKFLSGLAQRVRPILNHVRQIEELHALRHIGQRVSSSLKQEMILADALQAIVETMGFEYTLISLIDSAKQRIEAVKGSPNVSPEWIKMATHSLDSQDILADIVRTGKQERHVGWNPRFDRDIWQKFGHANLVRVFTPIKGSDEYNRPIVLGVIEAGYNITTRAEISQEQLRMLEVFGQQLFTALDNARLFEKTQRRAEILANLHRIGWEVAQARTDLSLVLDDVGNSLKRILGADIVMIYRYNHRSGLLELPRVYGEIKGLEKRSLRPPSPSEGIIAEVMAKRNPIYISDTQNHPLLVPPAAESGNEPSHRTFTQRQEIQSFAGVPMMTSGVVVGVLCVNYRSRHTFSKSHQQVLELAAQFAAVALYNAETNSIAEELAASRERMNLAQKLHSSLSASLPSIRYFAETARNQLPTCKESVEQNLDKTIRATSQAENELRINILDLNTLTLAQGELREVLEDYIRETRGYFNLDVSLEYGLKPETPLPLPLAREVWMVCREGVSNTIKHARATRLKLTIKADAEFVYVHIWDNGCGFEVQQLENRGRHGLKMMNERIQPLNGEVTVTSQPGAGTVIHTRIPLVQ